jgi:hypothetical protein
MVKLLGRFLVSQRFESQSNGVSRNNLFTKRKQSMEAPILTRAKEKPS